MQDSNQEFSNYLQLINNCDPDDPLLSDTSLGQCLNQVSLEYMNSNDLLPLNKLNLEQLIRASDGLARDYRGLAELMGFTADEIDIRFKRSMNPTKTLIDAFINRSLINKGGSDQSFTVNELLKMLERLERFDLIDDLVPVLIRIASNRSNAEKHLSLLPQNNRTAPKQHDSSMNLVNLEAQQRLTVDDTARSKVLYDAFICFATEDSHYAEELIVLLEEHGKRVATVDDLLPGHFEHDALVQLIDMRCRKVIIILTPNFLRSKECEFQSKFASEVAIRASSPKILPVLYEYCDDKSLPYMIRVVSKIDMTSKQAHRWQLKKLLSSLDFDQDLYQLNQQPQPTGGAYTSLMNMDSEPRTGHQSLMNHRSDSGIHTNEPIIDLLHSQNSSTIESLNDSTNFLTITDFGCPNGTQQNVASQRAPRNGGPISHSSNGNPLNWLRTVKKRVMGENSSGSNSPTPSTSSKAILLNSESSECFTNGFKKADRPNG